MILFLLPTTIGALFYMTFKSSLENNALFFSIIYLTLIIGCDVAHTHSSLFRTLLDPYEMRNRKLLTLSIPIVGYLFLLSISALFSTEIMIYCVFYFSVFHFVRQQIGWVSLSARKAKEPFDLDTKLDRGFVYLATLYPLFYWHTNSLPMQWWENISFYYFKIPDFATKTLTLAYYAATLGYCVRQLFRIKHNSTFNAGKYLIIGITWLTWHLPVFVFQSSLSIIFTISISHSIPYMYLLHQYYKTSSQQENSYLKRLMFSPLSVLYFYLPLLLFSYLHFTALNALVVHSNSPFYPPLHIQLSETALIFIKPLLALFAFCHYVFDMYVWKVPKRSTPFTTTLSLPSVAS